MGIPLPRFRHFCLLLIAIAAVVGVSCRDTQRFGAASVPVAYPACVNLEAGADATPGPTQCGPVSGVLPAANGGSGSTTGVVLASPLQAFPNNVGWWFNANQGTTLDGGQAGPNGWLFSWLNQADAGGTGYLAVPWALAGEPWLQTSCINGHNCVWCTDAGGVGSGIGLLNDGGGTPAFGAVSLPNTIIVAGFANSTTPSTQGTMVDFGTTQNHNGIYSTNSGLMACYDGAQHAVGSAFVASGTNPIPLIMVCEFGPASDGATGGAEFTSPFTPNTVASTLSNSGSGSTGGFSLCGQYRSSTNFPWGGGLTDLVYITRRVNIQELQPVLGYFQNKLGM